MTALPPSSYADYYNPMQGAACLPRRAARARDEREPLEARAPASRGVFPRDRDRA